MAFSNSHEVLEMLRQPVTIWAPNGWTYEYRLADNLDVKCVDDLFSPGFLRHDVRGPNGETNLWIFDRNLESIPDPSHDDLPRSWPKFMGIALWANTAGCEGSRNL